MPNRNVRSLVFKGVVGCALVLACAVSASAQVVVDPTILQFDPSPDHALLIRYDLEFYEPGATVPFQTTTIGKPTPGADGKITVLLNGVLPPYPPRGVAYTAGVASISPAGVGRSSPSNQFQFATCAFELSSAVANAPRDAGTGTIAILAAAGCEWGAMSGASWLTLSPGTGSGAGLFTFTVTENLSGAPRTAAVTVAGQTVSVTQSTLTALGTAATTFGSPSNLRIIR